MEPCGVVGEYPTWQPVQQLGIQHMDHRSYRQTRQGREGQGKEGPRVRSLRDGRLEQVWILRRKLSPWCDLIELLLTISLAPVPLLGTLHHYFI